MARLLRCRSWMRARARANPVLAVSDEVSDRPSGYCWLPAASSPAHTYGLRCVQSVRVVGSPNLVVTLLKGCTESHSQIMQVIS